MHAHQYEHEHQAQVIIDKYHQEASLARQIRSARREQPHPIANLSVRLRASLGAILIAAGEHIRHEPAAHPDPVSGIDPVAEPIDTAVMV